MKLWNLFWQWISSFTLNGYGEFEISAATSHSVQIFADVVNLVVWKITLTDSCKDNWSTQNRSSAEHWNRVCVAAFKTHSLFRFIQVKHFEGTNRRWVRLCYCYCVLRLSSIHGWVLIQWIKMQLHDTWTGSGRHACHTVNVASQEWVTCAD